MNKEMYDKIPYKWAETVRQLRYDTGITQTELAHRAGVNRGHIWCVENRKRNPTIAVLEALINSMGHTLEIYKVDDDDI
jgi:transcriptional regulator with XRE-family HTH domain|tara:strand:- start:199 stop:435 length:237 start_codon:yes stop_codon:yes gene_type:complete